MNTSDLSRRFSYNFIDFWISRTSRCARTDVSRSFWWTGHPMSEPSLLFVACVGAWGNVDEKHRPRGGDSGFGRSRCETPRNRSDKGRAYRSQDDRGDPGSMGLRRSPLSSDRKFLRAIPGSILSIPPESPQVIGTDAPTWRVGSREAEALRAMRRKRSGIAETGTGRALWW